MFPRDIIQWIKLPFRQEKELYRSLYGILGFYPGNIALYKQALLHKSSSVKGEKGRWQNNERLEFLGDAILDAVVGDIVYRRFEGKREGFLTNTRSKIVQRESLNRIATEIGLDRLVKCSGHSQSHNSYMGGNAFEALVGAIYLDRGYDACMQFMQHRILQQLVDIDKVAYREVNFKSKLIEWGQKHKLELEFRTSQTSENDNPVFLSLVVIEGTECGTGRGYSKKESHQMAAKATLQLLKKDREMEKRLLEQRDRRNAPAEEAPAEQPMPTARDEEMELEIDFTDVGRPMSREEIIAKAEAEAFGALNNE